MRRTRSMSIAMLVVAVAGALLAAAPAEVSRQAETADDPVTDRLPANFDRKILIRPDPIWLEAGEPRYFYGHFGGYTGAPMLQGVQIRCVSLETGEEDASVNTTMDHPGDSSVRVVAVRWLFTPTTSGYYDCAMNGFAHREHYSGEYLTVVGDQRTSLTVGERPSLGGAEWRVAADHRPSAYVDDPTTERREDRAVVMHRVWTAAPDATAARVFVGLEVSHELWGQDGFVGRTRVIATQLGPNDEACAAPVSTAKTRQWDVHHIKVHVDLPVPISTDDGCTRRFLVRTVLAYVPHPDPDVTRHGGVVEDDQYSNTIVTNQ